MKTPIGVWKNSAIATAVLSLLMIALAVLSTKQWPIVSGQFVSGVEVFYMLTLCICFVLADVVRLFKGDSRDLALLGVFFALLALLFPFINHEAAETFKTVMGQLTPTWFIWFFCRILFLSND